MLEVQELSVRYGSQAVLDGVGFSVAPGRLVGIVGPNGAGKSTLLKAILGLVPVAGGRALLGGAPIARVRERIAYVPQRASIDWDFPATVEDVVMMGRVPYMGWLARPGRGDRTRVAGALERVGMAGFAARRIGELSGGQQQRVFLARALVQEAELYLFDEPFLGVDAYTERDLLAICGALRDRGCMVLIVNHDLGDVVSRYDELLILRGEVVAWGPTERVFNQTNLNRAYLGQHVLV